MRTLGTVVALLCCFSLATPARAEPALFSEPDKRLHFSVSAGLAFAGYTTTAPFLSEQVRLPLVASVSFAVGLGKELFDLTSGRGSASFSDIAYDAAGIAAGLLVGWCLERLWSEIFLPAAPR